MSLEDGRAASVTKYDSQEPSPSEHHAFAELRSQGP